MTNLKVIVADDEPHALKLIKSYVEDTAFLELVATCKNAKEVLDQTTATPDIDIVFLDIQMPGISGMSLAKNLDSKIKVVFTTAFEHYAIEGYKVNAAGYLLKPFSYEEFLETATKVKNQLEKNKAVSSAHANINKDFMMVKADYKIWQIPLSDILYFEGVKDYVRIHRASEKKVLMPLMSMKFLEEYLPSDSFLRIHRSYIVNLNQIKVIERNQVVFGDVRITVSDNYKERFTQFLNQRFGK